MKPRRIHNRDLLTEILEKLDGIQRTINSEFSRRRRHDTLHERVAFTKAMVESRPPNIIQARSNVDKILKKIRAKNRLKEAENPKRRKYRKRGPAERYHDARPPLSKNAKALGFTF